MRLRSRIRKIRRDALAAETARRRLCADQKLTQAPTRTSLDTFRLQADSRTS